jgi:hypothetical protein
VVDRARVLMALQEGMVAGSLPPDEEIAILGRRRVLVNRAITFATVAALLVCLVIAFAFLGLLLGKNFGDVMAWLFIAAMASFITSLLSFLREIVLTVSTVRLGMRS